MGKEMEQEGTVSTKNGCETKWWRKLPWEWISFGLFAVASIIMYLYHEPWYDEIQAWMAASDASLWDIIFVLPHFEGHPPIWQLILAVFAKTGVPMEIGLRIPTFAFSAIAAWIIIFKAPFKKWMRCMIPFTYFLFYQYTIICRPYSILMLGFVLAALWYRTRNQKPIRFIIALIVMCMSSAYGMLFAGCICILWTWDIVCELKGKTFVKSALKDKRTWSLVGILVFAIVLACMIWPADTAFAQVRVVEFSRIRCLIYMFFMAPADALITDVAFIGRLQQNDHVVMFAYANIMCMCISVIMSTVLVIFAKMYRKIMLLILPYLAFGLYGALGYFYNHHLGIIPLFILFFLWCALDEKPEVIKVPKFIKKLEKSVTNLCKKIGYFFFGLSILVSLFWSVMAVKNDIEYPVWYAKGLAAIVEEYDLDQYTVMNQWTYSLIRANEKSEDSENEEKTENVENIENTSGELSSESEEEARLPEDILISAPLEARDYYQYVRMVNFVDILAYNESGENYIVNFNDGNNKERYVNHDSIPQDESLEYLMKLGEEYGYPEIVIGSPEIVGLMGLDATKYDYYPIYNFTCYRINKYNALYASSYVYAREDIYYSRRDWPIFEQAAQNQSYIDMEQ